MHLGEFGIEIAVLGLVDRDDLADRRGVVPKCQELQLGALVVLAHPNAAHLPGRIFD
jgi:hypothetical protein